MNLPTITLTQKEFDALPISTSGIYEQDMCRYCTPPPEKVKADLVPKYTDPKTHL